jgi:hypothetical protein
MLLHPAARTQLLQQGLLQSQHLSVLLLPGCQMQHSCVAV